MSMWSRFDKGKRMWLAIVIAILAVVFISLNSYDPDASKFDFVRAFKPDSERVETGGFEWTSAKSMPLQLRIMKVRKFSFKSASLERKSELRKELRKHMRVLGEGKNLSGIMPDNTSIGYDQMNDELIIASSRKPNWIETQWFRLRETVGFKIESVDLNTGR